jgi:hypothetical protein
VEFSDQYEFPKGSPPSPYGKPVVVVKVGEGMLPDGLTLRAIGWLERPGFPTGPVKKDCIDLLVNALTQGIFRDGYRGIHGCAFCGQEFSTLRWNRRKISLQGHGHYLIKLGKVVYMAPELLLHYIVDHKYCPPDEFVDAVLTGHFLTEDDLVIRWRTPGQDD